MALRTPGGYSTPRRDLLLQGVNIGDTTIDPATAHAVEQRIRARCNRHGCQPSQGRCPDPGAHPADVEHMTPVLQALGFAPYEAVGRIDDYGKRRRD